MPLGRLFSDLKFAKGKDDALAEIIENFIKDDPNSLSYTLIGDNVFGPGSWKTLFTPEARGPDTLTP